MYILGISCFYHDASAALLKDGEIVAAATEERFTRKKHDVSFPENAARFCLKQAGIKISEVEHVAFYEKPLLKFERILHQHLQGFPLSYKTFLGNFPSWSKEKLRIMNILRKKLKYKKDVLFVEHHMAHAASFLASSFENAAILTIDGVGEWTTTAYGYGKGNDIKLLKEIKFPSSIGLLYSTITAYLGFEVNNSEYKVMGLAAYGDMNKGTNEYYPLLRKIIDVKKDGSYRFDVSYFDYIAKDKMSSMKLCKLLGGMTRKKNSEITKRHKDIAAALQLITEEIVFGILNHVYEKTKKINGGNLVISGGVGLNSVLNGKVLENTKFERLWAQPDPGDGGTSLGAALYVYNVIFGKKREFVFDDAYLGPEFSDREIRAFLESKRIKYHEFENEEKLVKEVARAIYENNIVGWFQGRMEFGPRALGNRSILSNPCNPDMQKILNEKVKHREGFRPFAPVVCKEDVKKFFDLKKGFLDTGISDFMLVVSMIKKKWHTKIPSVVHVDGTGRLQTISKKQNERYYKLVKEFGKLSGVSVLINTSFNVQGEPIVCTPEDAYKCVLGTGIDLLIIGNFLIKREENINGRK